MSGPIVGHNYLLGHKIGSGSFGDFYCAKDITNGEDVGVKVENIFQKNLSLEHESQIYNQLLGGLGLPSILWFGREVNHNVMVMDLLGPSLEDLFDRHYNTFSIKTILMIADKMFHRIEFVHKKNIIHKDLKPRNFLMGSQKHCNELFLIDFGLAQKYWSSDGKHIPYTEDNLLIGTVRYFSINAHKRIQQSRRDDMESLAYVLIYLMRGSLPWNHIRGKNIIQRSEKIFQLKNSITVEELCYGLPHEFSQYLKYCRTLGFDEKPDYCYSRQLFRNLFQRLNYHFDCVYDWTVVVDKRKEFDAQSGDHYEWCQSCGQRMGENIEHICDNSVQKSSIGLIEEHELISISSSIVSENIQTQQRQTSSPTDS